MMALARRAGLRERAGLAPEAAAALAVFALELSCLRRGAGTFAEQLYGLRRAPPRGAGGGRAAGAGGPPPLALPLRDRVLVALAAAVAPSLRALLLARRDDARSLGRARAAADWLGVGGGAADAARGAAGGDPGPGPGPPAPTSPPRFQWRLGVCWRRLCAVLVAWYPGVLLTAWDAASLSSSAAHALGLSRAGPGLMGLLLRHRLVRAAPGDLGRLMEEQRGGGGGGRRPGDAGAGGAFRRASPGPCSSRPGRGAGGRVVEAGGGGGGPEAGGLVGPAPARIPTGGPPRRPQGRSGPLPGVWGALPAPRRAGAVGAVPLPRLRPPLRLDGEWREVPRYPRANHARARGATVFAFLRGGHGRGPGPAWEVQWKTETCEDGKKKIRWMSLYRVQVVRPAPHCCLYPHRSTRERKCTHGRAPPLRISPLGSTPQQHA